MVHPAQVKVHHKAAKALKRSKLQARLDDLINDMTPYVAAQTGLDTDKAKKQARRWVLECVAELVAMPLGDVIFLP